MKTVRLPASRTVNLVTEEIEIMMQALKKYEPKTDLQRRGRKRILMRLLGQGVGRFPLHPDRECPVCETSYSHKIYDRHVFACKRKQSAQRRAPPVDPAILEMIEAGL